MTFAEAQKIVQKVEKLEQDVRDAYACWTNDWQDCQGYGGESGSIAFPRFRRAVDALAAYRVEVGID